MNKVFAFLILGCVLVNLTGCTSLVQRKNEQVSKLSYAVSDSIHKGRFDLASSYSAQLNKLVPPPKKKIVVNGFVMSIVKNKNVHGQISVNVVKNGIFTKDEVTAPVTYIVLPPDIDALKVKTITKDSSEFKDLVKSDPVLQKTEKQNDKNVAFAEKTTDKIVIDIQRAAEKAKSKNIFSTIFSFFKGFLGIGILGTIIVLVVVAFVAPALLPEVLGFIGSAINWVFELVIGGCKGIGVLIQNLFKKKV